MHIFLGLSLYFKVRNSVFSYVVKSFWYALILLRHTWIKTERKGSYKKIFYPIRQNRVPYLEIKLEMAKNPNFFLSFRPLLLFLPCILCIFFFFFFVLLLPLILLLLLLLLNNQIRNFLGAFTLFQGKELCFFLCGKKFLIRPYSAASYMN